MIVDGTKKCSKCGEVKPLEEFYKRKQRKCGYNSWCISCCKERYVNKQYPKPVKQRNYKDNKPGFKFCRLCGEEKPISEFYKKSSSKDGLNYRCKTCVNEKYNITHPNVKHKEYHICKNGYSFCTKCKTEKQNNEFFKNSDGKPRSWCKKCVREYNISRSNEISEYSKKYREKNKERIQEYLTINSEYIASKKSEWYYKDREYQILKAFEYRILNKNEISKRRSISYFNNVEENRERSKIYRINNREAIAKRMSTYKKTPAGRAAVSRINHNRRCKNDCVKNTLTARQWEKILERQNYICDDCRRSFDKKLKPTKDHAIPLHFKWFGLTLGNTIALCQSCNSKKYNHTYFIKWAYELSPEALNGTITSTTSTNH